MSKLRERSDQKRSKTEAGKCIPEEPTESSGELNVAAALDKAIISKSVNFCIVPFDEFQEAASRDEVVNVLKLFKKQYTESMEEWNKKPKAGRKGNCRADLKAAKILKKNMKWINHDDQYIGSVPGVRMGDRFQYRSELAVIGLHRHYVCGIHYENIGGTTYATSIVDSGRYYKNKESGDKFYYMGEGGNPEVLKSEPKDQRLDGGNCALVNSMIEDLPVRVIRGRRSSVSFNTMGVNTENGFSFVYDGLYKVVNYTTDKDSTTGKKMYKFEMVRVTYDPNITQMISYQPRKSTMQRKQGMVNASAHQEEKTPILSSKQCFVSQRNKDEKLECEAAAHLAKPIVTTRHQEARIPIFVRDDTRCQEKKTHISSFRQCFVSQRNKDEKVDYEVAAHLANPIVPTGHQEARIPIFARDDMRHHEENIPIPAEKDVRFTYYSIANGNDWKAVYSNSRDCFVSQRNKDEKFDYEAAAHLAMPIAPTRRQYAKHPNTIPKSNQAQN